MENNQNPSQTGNTKKPDKGGLILIGIIVLVIVAVIIYFVVSGSGSSGSGGTTALPPDNMGELLELNDLNIHGSWFRDEADGSRYEIRFSANNVLHFYMYDAEGNTVAESDEGTYATENDKLYLSIISDGAVYEDICTAMVSINVLFISADEGTGLFNGTYLSEYQVPDYLLGDDSETESSQTESTNDEITSTEPSTTDPTVDEPTKNFQLPDVVDELFSMTAEEYFRGSVSNPNDILLDGWACYNAHVDKFNVVIIYETSGDYRGSGYPIILSFYADEILPDLSSYNYNGLLEYFGNDLNSEYNDEVFGSDSYRVWVGLDKYTLNFGAVVDGLTSLDEEIKSCYITRNANSEGSTVQAEYHLPGIVKTLLSVTAEEYFGGNVPVGKFSMAFFGVDYDVYEDGCSYSVHYGESDESSRDNGRVYGTGYAEYVTAYLDEIMPGLDSYNYYSLKEVLGDNIQCAGGDGMYDIWATIDGYTLNFTYYYPTDLESELRSCFIVPDRM